MSILPPLNASARAVWRDQLREAGLWSVEKERWGLLIDADADACAYADADANAYADKELNEETMQGLYAVTLWQGGGRMVLRVGWFRPRSTDGTHEASWVTVYRSDATTRLAEVWRDGPSRARWAGFEFSEPLPVDDVQRLHVVPLAKLDEKLWASVCPRPEGW